MKGRSTYNSDREEAFQKALHARNKEYLNFALLLRTLDSKNRKTQERMIALGICNYLTTILLIIVIALLLLWRQ